MIRFGEADVFEEALGERRDFGLVENLGVSAGYYVLLDAAAGESPPVAPRRREPPGIFVGRQEENDFAGIGFGTVFGHRTRIGTVEDHPVSTADGFISPRPVGTDGLAVEFTF